MGKGRRERLEGRKDRWEVIQADGGNGDNTGDVNCRNKR